MERATTIEAIVTRSGERGSALVIALLVIVMMTLLGVPFLLMGSTESRIAENERLTVQAAYASETGARMVKRWFDRPLDSANVINPPLAVLDRTLRLIDADGDPGTAPLLTDNTATKPWYKKDVDLDADGNDDVFQRPHRADLVNTLLGTELGPDVRIDPGFSTAAATFLEDMSLELFGGFPAGGTQARITRIDVYAPPYVDQAGTWTRFGMATAKVTAGIYRSDGAPEALAERTTKFVLNEIPYRTAELGAVHSCDDLVWDQGFSVHWGVATAQNAADLGGHSLMPASLPRAPAPSSLWLDEFWDDTSHFTDYLVELYAANTEIDDPWLRFVSGGSLNGTPTGAPQPWPFPWSTGQGPLVDGQYPYHPDPGPEDGSHSAYFQNTAVGCPKFPYEEWKPIALRGGPGVHYYTRVFPTDPPEFRENGAGDSHTFREITDDRTGLFFFDTRDGLPPAADGSNLTPSITVSGGTWGTRGFIYVNADVFKSHAAAGRPAEFRPPGEPFLDADTNGVFNAEEYVNLAYPTALVGTGSEFIADITDTFGGGGVKVWNSRGDLINDDANLWGVLYTTGRFDSTGSATYYGSVIAEKGIDSLGVEAETPDVYWDQSLRVTWPPPSWGMPLVAVTHWETDY